LGWITEYNADLMCYSDTYSPNALQASRAQADAVGAMTIWIRDRRTGKLANPYVNAQDMAFISLVGHSHEFPRPAHPTSGAANAFIDLDQAHMPSPAWIPYRLTDDPYWYECTEAQANFAIFFTDGHRGAQTPVDASGNFTRLDGFVYTGEQ